MMSDDVKKASQLFYEEFQQTKKDFQIQLDSLSSQSTDVRQKTLANLKSNLIQLEKKVTDASIFLPQYDQRQFAMQLKDIQTLIAKNSATKPKFSFKKAKAVTTASITQASQKQQQENQSQVTEPKSNTRFEIPANALHFHDVSNQILVLDTDEKDSYRDVYLESLDHCIVYIKARRISSLHIRNMRSVIVLGGPVRGSSLIQDCQNTLLSFGCRQFRCHDSKDVDVYLHASSAPIIEDCTGFRFAPYSYPLPEREDVFREAELNLEENQFAQVQDFKWLRAQSSPNWKVLPEQDRLSESDWSTLASQSKEILFSEVLDKYVPLSSAKSL